MPHRHLGLGVLRSPGILARTSYARIPSLDIRDLSLYTLDGFQSEVLVLLGRITAILFDVLADSSPMPVYLVLIVRHDSLLLVDRKTMLSDKSLDR
jgi:hypothetical protein